MDTGIHILVSGAKDPKREYLIGFSDLCIGATAGSASINSSPTDNMAAILADDIFKCIFLNETDKIPI